VGSPISIEELHVRQTHRPDRGLAAPDAAWQQQLIGFVTGHNRLAGHRRFIQTSGVLVITNDLTKAETLNTLYTLRRPLTEVRLEVLEPVHVALADLVAARLAGDHWQIIRGPQIVRDGIPGYQAAVLYMLDLLDRRDRGLSQS
jgi:hypothetical protein